MAHEEVFLVNEMIRRKYRDRRLGMRFHNVHQRQQNAGGGLFIPRLRDNSPFGAARDLPAHRRKIGVMLGDYGEDALARNQLFDARERMLEHRATADESDILLRQSIVAELSYERLQAFSFSSCEYDATTNLLIPCSPHSYLRRNGNLFFKSGGWKLAARRYVKV